MLPSGKLGKDMRRIRWRLRQQGGKDSSASPPDAPAPSRAAGQTTTEVRRRANKAHQTRGICDRLVLSRFRRGHSFGADELDFETAKPQHVGPPQKATTARLLGQEWRATTVLRLFSLNNLRCVGNRPEYASQRV